MPRLAILSLAALVASSCLRAEDPAADSGLTWSRESNGLRARLSVSRAYVVNGTGIIVTYVELENTGTGSVRVTVGRENTTFRVTDAGGAEVPMCSGPYSGMEFGTPELVLPHQSSIRFRIGPCGWAIPGDQAALVDLGSSSGWALPRDDRDYYLQGVLEIAEEKGHRSQQGTPWHGRLDLPRVRIPTATEPIDPTKLGPLIKDLGTKMLAKPGRVSDGAVRRLSLIDDPRVIPWYVKAVKTNRSDLKIRALDRLSRLAGDEALAGLRIGMTTRSEDIGDCTTPAIAAGAAASVRHCAAIALARSPHPQAKTLLLSMHDDPAAAVRLAVLQAAAKMDTPEARELLERHARDADATIRSEALRLRQLRTGASEK